MGKDEIKPSGKKHPNNFCKWRGRKESVRVHYNICIEPEKKKTTRMKGTEKERAGSMICEMWKIAIRGRRSCSMDTQRDG